MRQKNLVSLFLCVFLFAIFPFAALAQFSDVQKDSLTYMYRHGIIDGYPDGTFGPEKTINRAELLKMIMDASHEAVSDINEDCFPDVPKDEWFGPYVCTAKNSGWVEGYSDGSFKPEQPINKVETLKIIAEVQGWGTSESCSDSATSFQDVEACAWYFKYLTYAEDHFFVDQGNAFEPANNILREDVAEILFRTILEEKLGRMEEQSNGMYDRTLAAIARDFFNIEDVASTATFDDATAAFDYAVENAELVADNPGDVPADENRITMWQLEDGNAYAVFPVPLSEYLQSAACPHYCLDPWMVAKFDQDHHLVAFDWMGLSQAPKYSSLWNLLEVDGNKVLVEDWTVQIGSSPYYKSEPYAITLENTR